MTEVGYLWWFFRHTSDIVEPVTAIIDLAGHPLVDKASWREEFRLQSNRLIEAARGARTVVPPQRFSAAHRTYMEAMTEYATAGRLIIDWLDTENPADNSALLGQAASHLENGTALFELAKLQKQRASRGDGSGR